MRYSFISAAVLAFTSVVFAADPSIDFDPMSVPTKTIDTVAAGSDYTIKWTAPLPKYKGTVTLSIMEGKTTDSLAVNGVIAAGIDNALNSYTWSIPKDIASFPTYGIQISWDNDTSIFQWSYPFHITTTAVSSTSVSASGSASNSASGSPTSTKTIQLATGSAYTSTSTVISSSTSSNSVATTSSTMTTVSTAQTTSAATNGTLMTTGAPSGTTTSSVSSTSSAVAVKTNGAASNFAHGSFAVIGGALIALVL